ncbi:hypothetical protein BCAR13_820022 [Paraburkholderia caribensis]|nr:hypothetical protein BCAR13_820022 [Paraburkholderia caribensis]
MPDHCERLKDRVEDVLSRCAPFNAGAALPVKDPPGPCTCPSGNDQVELQRYVYAQNVVLYRAQSSRCHSYVS